MLICTLLTFALCADPDVAAAISFEGLTVPILWSTVRLRSCAAFGPAGVAEEAGRTVFQTVWTTRRNSDGSASSERVTVRMDSARIDMQAIGWSPMSAAERAALRRVYRATLWHELGHLVTAERSIAAANAAGLTASDTEAAFARLHADQDDYDRITDHGIKQDAAPGPLRGEDAVLTC